jgi:hypothetical protein
MEQHFTYAPVGAASDSEQYTDQLVATSATLVASSDVLSSPYPEASGNNLYGPPMTREQELTQRQQIYDSALMKPYKTETEFVQLLLTIEGRSLSKELFSFLFDLVCIRWPLQPLQHVDIKHYSVSMQSNSIESTPSMRPSCVSNTLIDHCCATVHQHWSRSNNRWQHHSNPSAQSRLLSHLLRVDAERQLRPAIPIGVVQAVESLHQHQHPPQDLLLPELVAVAIVANASINR